MLPYGLIRRYGTPQTTGIYILHEGPIGVVDTTLKERGYDDLRSEVSEFKSEENGGWVGFTDKYWLTSLFRDQAQKSNFTMRSLGGIEDRYQADYLGAPQILSKGQTISYRITFLCWC